MKFNQSALAEFLGALRRHREEVDKAILVLEAELYGSVSAGSRGAAGAPRSRKKGPASSVARNRKDRCIGRPRR